MCKHSNSFSAVIWASGIPRLHLICYYCYDCYFLSFFVRQLDKCYSLKALLLINLYRCSIYHVVFYFMKQSVRFTS